MDAEMGFLTDTLIGEISNALGFSKTGLASRLLNFPFRKAVGRLSMIGVTADQMIATDGFPAAATWMMSHWVREMRVRGAETIPAEGPLLVVTNHCGAYDFLVIPSQINRRDIRIIASDIPFLKKLKNASDHLFFLSDALQTRGMAARGALRSLQNGEALLLFGTGLVDPDPAVYTGAEIAIDDWSPSIDLFLRMAPETKVVLGICSGIVSKRWAHHLLTCLRRIPWQKRRLAEFGQVLEQLFRPGKLLVDPCLSFAPPVSVEQLRRESGGARTLPVVINRGRVLLKEHLAWIKSLPKVDENAR